MAKDTREKLMKAALDVFAEQGYQAATIQEIVKRAGSNIAAINYHFRDKANFYVEVIVYGMSQAGQETLEFTDSSQTPCEQLEGFIQWFLMRSLGYGQDSLINQIHLQEMMNPSPVLDQVVEKLIRPVHAQLRHIIAQLLPINTSEEMIRLHCFSVIGQCNLYKMGKPIIARLYPDFSMSEVAVQTLAKHITRVSLAGLASEKKVTCFHE